MLHCSLQLYRKSYILTVKTLIHKIKNFKNNAECTDWLTPFIVVIDRINCGEKNILNLFKITCLQVIFGNTLTSYKIPYEVMSGNILSSNHIQDRKQLLTNRTSNYVQDRKHILTNRTTAQLDQIAVYG
jgi:hypothetical protein